MKRRGRGEGSLFRRRDGIWCGIITIGYTPEGRRRRRYVYGATKGEVLDTLIRLRADALQGRGTDPHRLTVGAFLTRWCEDTLRPSVREATYQLYRMVIRRHLVPHLGGMRLAQLAPPHVQGLVAEMERRGASPRMRRLAYTVLRRALRQAVEWTLISRNPCAVVSAPRVPRREMRVLTPDQARRFLHAARGDRLEALYYVLIGCGLRLGEALGLTWGDVDLERGTITVCRQLCEVGGTLSVQEPKTSSARRTVHLPAVVRDALHEHRERMRAEGHPCTDRSFVFVDAQGTPLYRSNIRQRSFLPILKRAGVPRLRLHDLRHTAATLHLRQGTHPVVVQRMLGHSRAGITLDVYSHYMSPLGAEAAQRIDTLLRGATDAEE